MELPRGATAVDFAYAVHSDIGNSCVAAKINRRLAPLSQPLTNGQTVEIITAPGACPNPNWLNFVVTGKARSNIRHYLKTQQRDESVQLGKRLLAHALSDIGAEELDEFSAEKQHEIASQLEFSSFDELCEAIGLGNQVAPVVAQHFIGEPKSQPAVQEEQPLQIRGTEGMVVSYADCCRPIPGDVIIGYLEAGVGIVVHVETCKKITRMRMHHPERLIVMRWEEHISGDFRVDCTVELANQRGVLALLASAIAEAGSNIENISVSQGGDGLYHTVRLTISVSDRRHLAKILRKVRSIRAVIRITRQR